MPKRKLRKEDKLLLLRLGRKVRKIIIKERGYKSLDAFSVEFDDIIAKPTIYRICDGDQDLYFLSLIKICEALDISIFELLNGVIKESKKVE